MIKGKEKRRKITLKKGKKAFKIHFLGCKLKKKIAGGLPTQTYLLVGKKSKKRGGGRWSKCTIYKPAAKCWDILPAVLRNQMHLFYIVLDPDPVQTPASRQGFNWRRLVNKEFYYILFYIWIWVRAAGKHDLKAYASTLKRS